MAKKSEIEDADPQYEERIILFLDFLGFKELVDRTARERGFLKQLISAMNMVGQIGSDNAAVSKSQRITQFSDSIVVSYKVAERSAAFWLMNEMGLLVVQLAEKGFLVRGGLTVGQLLHSDRHVVGPAMNEAYRLESKVAKYPRVVIDPKLLQVARRARSSDHPAHQEEEYVRAFITKDADGQLFFDYISWNSVVAVVGGDNELYGDYLGRLSMLIRDGLRHDEPAVQEKYLWMRSRYRAAIEQIRALPADSGYRLENPALCEQIASLPILKIDTQLARAAVKKAARAAKAGAKPRKVKKSKKP